MATNEPLKTRKRNIHIVVLACSYLASVHFAFGIFLTLRLGYATDIPTTFIWFSLPYIAILGIFVTSIVLGHSRHYRGSIVALVLGLLVSVGACIYDFQNYRYQIGGGGIGATYTIWWWYYEPFWHGYKPGNV